MTREHVSTTAVGALAALTLIPAFWPDTAAALTCGDPVPLIAGRTLDVGAVTVCNDENNLQITYQVEAPWCLRRTHLHVATDPADIPQTRSGNPIPGRFDHKSTFDCAIEDDQGFTLAWAVGDVLNIAAYAKVTNLGTGESEGAWAGDTAFPGPTWATYFTYEVQSSQPGTSCVVDEFVAGDQDGAFILAQLCPGGQLGDSVISHDSVDAGTLVAQEAGPGFGSYEVGTSPGIVFFGQVHTLGNDPGGSFKTIPEGDFRSCQEHIRVSCGLPTPDR